MEGDPALGHPVDSVVAMLLRGATRRALSEVEIESRQGDDSWQARVAETAQVRLWLDQLDNGDSGATRPIGW